MTAMPPTQPHAARRAPVEWAAWLVAAVLAGAALAVRVRLYPIITSDYTVFLSPWYDFILAHGRFAALGQKFSNYNPPYLYLLALTTYLPISKLAAIKSLSVVFDVVLAGWVVALLRLKYRRPWVPLLGGLLVLWLPTVMIDSAAWGQCDAMYTSFCLGSLYWLLRRRWAAACALFGVALAFKLQAIFLLPVLVMLALKRTLPLRHLALIPAVYAALLLPAVLAGHDVTSLALVYVQQAVTGGLVGTDAAGGNLAAVDPANSFASLSFNTPSLYQWLKDTPLAYNKWLGIVLAALAVGALTVVMLRRATTVSTELLLSLSLACAVAIPFFLPAMHERYFYLADLLALIYALYRPRFALLALGLEAASLLSYTPYFWDREVVSLPLVATVVLAIVIVAVTRVLQSAALLPSGAQQPAHQSRRQLNR